MSNKDAVAKHRNKKRSELGDTEYKKREAAKRKERRHRANPPAPKPEKPEKPEKQPKTHLHQKMLEVLIP